MATIQAEQRTVYVTKHTCADGTKHRKVCLSAKGAASAAAWWLIFERYNDPTHYGLPMPHNSKWADVDNCSCNPYGYVMFDRDMECDLHGRGGYFERMHERLARWILAVQAVQP